MSVRVIQGDCRDVLASLPAESVHCVVTSPPYWGLRDYKIPPTIWGGDADCAHKWGDEGKIGQRLRNGEGSNTAKQAVPITFHPSTGAFCRCGSWSGALGLEPTYQLYVEHMVEVFRAVRRVLRKDGTLWINLGDSYAAGKCGRTDQDRNTRNGDGRDIANASDTGAPFYHRREISDGLKPKNLCGIPWRVAFSLQDDGWYLRQDIIWSKPNPMPESVTDRCTKAHEYLFLLTKSARYFYDADAIREDGPSYVRSPGHRSDGAGEHIQGRHTNFSIREVRTCGRNKRSVWEIATSPFPEAHFATFPPALIEPCIKAGTSERGCCAKCGAPWERKVEKGQSSWEARKACGHIGGIGGSSKLQRENGGTNDFDNRAGGFGKPASVVTIGWEPSCTCEAATIPCTVLDPFGGAGTTGLVADRLQRDAVLIELSDAYCVMAERRIHNDAPLFNTAAE